jgi:hypothetical protein
MTFLIVIILHPWLTLFLRPLIPTAIFLHDTQE